MGKISVEESFQCCELSIDGGNTQLTDLERCLVANPRVPALALKARRMEKCSRPDNPMQAGFSSEC